MERLGLNKNIRIKNELKRYIKKQNNKQIYLKEQNRIEEVQEECLKKQSKKFKKGNEIKKNKVDKKGEREENIKISESVIENHKKRRIKKRRRRIIACLCIIIPILVFELFTSLIEPSIIAMCEIRANSIGVSVSNKAIKQVMEEVGYDMQLVKLEKDEGGNIIALQSNVVEMNYISSLIGSRTQQMYNELTEAYIKIPIGNFTGNALLAGHGPSLQVKIVPVGTVGSDFKTEFVSTGINQTRHRVYLQVISSMRVIAPFTTKTIKVVNNVNVAETVLIGDVPNSYYNLEGVDNIGDDSLNLWDE